MGDTDMTVCRVVLLYYYITMATVGELEIALEKAKEQESKRKEELERENNYERFLKRNPDAVIGLAHCDIGDVKIGNSRRKRSRTLWDTISIHWNCGTDYNSSVSVTESTYTYFHNVWTDKQRSGFQNKLNTVAVKEIKKIMCNLPFVLDIMWLQATDFYKNTLYPLDKVGEIESIIEKEQKNILDSYKDEDFVHLITAQTWYRQNEDWSYGDMLKYKDISLSHSSMILYRYIFKYRPSLRKVFKETNTYDRLKGMIEQGK